MTTAPVKVKICGVKDPDLVRFAAQHGADWIGFTFVEASPRHVTPEAAESLLLQIGEARPVALLVDPDNALLDRIAALGFPVLQLHGAESPERVAEIKVRTGCEIWKAIGVSTRADLDAAAMYEGADRLLLDAKPPKGTAQTGGHGQAFDWSILKDWQAPKPWLLAGGLTPENVAEAIRQTGAHAVDVSSGVERVRGLKDRALVRAFITNAKTA